MKHSSLRRIITCCCSLMELVNPSMIRPRRRRFQYGETLLLTMIFTCCSLLVMAATSKPCSAALQNTLGNDACRSNKDISSGIGTQIMGLAESLTITCPDSNLFCFRSILPGFLSSEEDAPPRALSEGSGRNDLPELSETEEKGNMSWPSNCGVLKFTRCTNDHWKPKYHRTKRVKEEEHEFSCGERLLDHGILGFTSKQVTTKTLDISDDYSPTSLEIHPIVLDWGKKYLYLPSMAALTIVNRHSTLTLSLENEPYSTNPQFYPYNFTETHLAPGEVASITFVFLPLSLGLSSSQLVLQTSFGGFLIQCTGFALESPYGISIGLDDVSSNGKLRKNISLSNPFNEALYIEEVVSWIYSSELKKEVCCVNDHTNWEIRPQAIETVLELDLSFLSKGKVSGMFCMQLFRPSGEKIDTIVVPLEAELLHQKISTNNDLTSVVSVSLQVPVSDPDVVVVSLKNNAPYVLRVVKISEIGDDDNNSVKKRFFHIKYMEGLILFPESETQIALVKKLHHPTTHEFRDDINEFCELVVVTNDTRNSQVKIRCEDVFSVCLQDSQQLPNKVLNSDEMILKNWKSQATSNGLSVLGHNEVVFPVVQVGGYWFEFITVKNPTSKPIIVQLILNSGEIVDKCNAQDNHFPASFSSFIINNKSVSPSRYGFSMVEGALTEALINPNGVASLGPVFFQPSNRCEWSSSLVIRNNLSGVEWLPLKGFGGLLSLVLLEESKPVKALDFKLISSKNHINSCPGFLCSQPLVKEVYAKNTGDLPLEVRRIEVSGTECGLDGFTVENCRGFAVQPGESVKLRILYRTDFSSATIHRDLELGLGTGIIVIPMKASIPVYMLDSCRKSIFKTRLKKFVLAFILFASVYSLVFCYLLPYNNTRSSNKSSLNTYARKPSSPSICKKNRASRVIEAESLESKYSSSEEVKLLKCTTDYDEATTEVLLLRNSVKETPLLLSSPHAMVLENGGIQETKQSGNLTVKTGKDKGRRRRKKKGTSGNVLSGFIEVSSSHSGNSTPSSPLSPVSTILTPKPQPSVSPLMVTQQHPEPIPKTDFVQKNLLWGTPVNPNPNPNPCSTLRKPVLMPSATFPCGGKPLSYRSAFSASTSAIGPLARAPGSKLQGAKAVKAEEKGEEFIYYDIWGEHIFSGGSSSRSKGVISGMQNSYTSSSNSNSYFVRGPLALMTEAQSEAVSCSNPAVG